MKRGIIGILAGWCIAALFLGAASTFAEGEGKDKDYVVADIGKEKIMFSEIEKAAEGLNRFLKENFETSKDWRLNFVRQYIAQIALAKRAVREGLDKKEDVIYTIEKAKRGILADKILNNRLSELVFSEDDFKKYYEQNKEKYQIKEKVKVSYIKFKTKGEAERAVGKLNKGKSFQKIGRKKIVKLESWISKDAPFVPELEGIQPEGLNALFSLGVGGSSQAIEAKEGAYIFRVDEKEPAKDRPFEEVRKQIEFEVARVERERVINEFVMETFGQENIRLYENRVIEDMK